MLKNDGLKRRILEELVYSDEDAFNLAREIYTEYSPILKKGIGLSDIYNRIIELKNEAKNEQLL